MNDNSRQLKIWRKEWENPKYMKTVPRHGQMKPTQDVVEFVNDYGQARGKIIDLGCGIGRNTIYLIEEEFEKVYAVDFVQHAVDALVNTVDNHPNKNLLIPFCCRLDEKWPFEDNLFDFAIDSLTSTGIDTLEGRTMFVREMYRTLKRGGLALVRVVSSDDELEKELMRKYPGPEPNSSIWPGIGKFQKNFTESELKRLYEGFKFLDSSIKRKPAFKAGRRFLATNLVAIIQKP